MFASKPQPPKKYHSIYFSLVEDLKGKKFEGEYSSVGVLASQNQNRFYTQYVILISIIVLIVLITQFRANI